MTQNADFNPPPEPWDLFREWYEAAAKKEINDPDAMALATLGDDGMPSVRMVLLKAFGPEGLTFFTNRTSRKGKQLNEHPQAAICLHWKSLRRQIRAEGLIATVSDKDSDTYFASRSRGSQIGAWASDQSQPLAGRDVLEKRAAEFEKKFEGMPVPRPPHWGGYCIRPLMLEFWQDGAHRLHDRILYRRETEQAGWTTERLYP